MNSTSWGVVTFLTSFRLTVSTNTHTITMLAQANGARRRQAIGTLSPAMMSDVRGERPMVV